MVYGPYWFAGPDFSEKHEIYPAEAQPRERYADHFFAWVYDFNGDGWNDVLDRRLSRHAGVSSTRIRASEGFDKPWPKHQVLDSVTNESPQFVNVVGDERPELVCTHNGLFGYATFDPAKPFEPWTFHAISEKIAPVPFGHGLGVGDVNGDGRTRHSDERRLVRAAGGSRGRSAVEAARGEVRRAGRGRDVRLRRGWRRRQRRDHQPGRPRLRPRLVRAGEGRRQDRVSRAHDHGRPAGREPLRPGVQRAALGQPGRHRRRRPQGHRHRQDVLVAPHAKPDVGRRGGRLLVQARARRRTGSIGFRTRPTARRASAGR